MTKQGPNVKRLIIHKMSTLMIPSGGGLSDGIRALSSSESIGKYAREATEWVEEVLTVVKTAPDNPYGNDEVIAGEILRQIETRKPGHCQRGEQ